MSGSVTGVVCRSRPSRNHEARVVLLNVWVTQDVVCFGESRGRLRVECLGPGWMKRLIWRQVTMERPGRAENILKVRYDKICEKTQGSDIWLFWVFAFPMPSTLPDIMLKSSKCLLLNKWTNLSGRKESVRGWKDSGKELGDAKCALKWRRKGQAFKLFAKEVGSAGKTPCHCRRSALF